MAGKGWWGESGKLQPDGASFKNSPYVFIRTKGFLFKTVSFLLFVGFIFSFLLVANNNPGRAVQYYQDGRVVYPPSLAALASSCMGITEVPAAPPETVGWVEEPDVNAVPRVPEDEPFWYSTPPVGGNFYKVPFLKTDEDLPFNGNVREGEIPTLGGANSLLYRGWIVIWYRSSVVSEDSVKTFQSSLRSVEGLSSKVLVSPWPYEETINWAGAKPWLLTAWGSWQKCESASVRVVSQFREANPESNAPGYQLPLLEPGPEAVARNKQFPDSRVENFEFR